MEVESDMPLENACVTLTLAYEDEECLVVGDNDINIDTSEF